MGIEEQIKEYIKENLSIQIKSETNDFMSTDGSTRTCFTINLILDGEVISWDSLTS